MKPLQQWTPAVLALLTRQARRMVFIIALRGLVVSFACFAIEYLALKQLPNGSTTIRGSIVLVLFAAATGAVLWSIHRLRKMTWLTIANRIESADSRFEHRLITLVSVDLRGETSPLVQSLRNETEKLAANKGAGTGRITDLDRTARRE